MKEEGNCTLPLDMLRSLKVQHATKAVCVPKEGADKAKACVDALVAAGVTKPMPPAYMVAWPDDVEAMSLKDLPAYERHPRSLVYSTCVELGLLRDGRFTCADAKASEILRVAVLDDKNAGHPGEIDREGAILTGFSLGAYSAVQIARNHPGRWPYLILNEANVALDAAQLRAAGVKAVALLAGERGSQVAGEKRTVESLARQGFPARLWVMKGAGHFYSADIDALMADAVTFVLSEGAASDAGAAK